MCAKTRKKIAAEFSKKGDATGWFDALYSEAAGNHEHIPWADLEPNKFLKIWADKTNLRKVTAEKLWSSAAVWATTRNFSMIWVLT